MIAALQCNMDYWDVVKLKELTPYDSRTSTQYGVLDVVENKRNIAL